MATKKLHRKEQIEGNSLQSRFVLRGSLQH